MAGGDAKCQTRADAAGLGGAWKAWLSDSTTNAKDRIEDAQYVRLDNALIANNKADLTDGTIANPISINENNITQSGNRGVWTGTNPDGNKASGGDFANCVNWTGDGSGIVGIDDLTTSLWTFVGALDCSVNPNRLYCFE